MFSLAQLMGWDCLIVGISLAKVTMATIAFCGTVSLLSKNETGLIKSPACLSVPMTYYAYSQTKRY
jgi:hypothetical protein